VWFDVWKCCSVPGTGVGYDDAVNFFVRLPSKRGDEPIVIKDPELLNWIKFLAFYPDLCDEEIALIEESTSGASEMLQEAKMSVGTDQEREMIQARERYRHDQASRVFEYEEQTRSLGAEITALTTDNRFKDVKISSLAADKLKSERKLIARMLRVRFNAPDAASPVRSDLIDTAETLDRLLDYSADRKDYDAFLKNSASCDGGN